MRRAYGQGQKHITEYPPKVTMLHKEAIQQQKSEHLKENSQKDILLRRQL